MNNTPAVPLGPAMQNGNVAYQYLGTLWSQLFRDTKAVQGYMAGHSVLQAQTYLNFLEALNLVDRKNVPVFHRERWRMIILRKSQKNTGPAAALKLGGDNPPVIGPQTSEPYVPGAIFTIGGYTAEVGVTTYPTGSAGLVDVVTAISDSIAGPKHVLIKNVDFTITDETILFFNGKDPFDLGFPTRVIDNGDGTTDLEVGLWASDAMIDRTYPYNYAGYVLGLPDESSEFYMRYINALWDLHNGSGTSELFQAGLAALLDEPCIVHDQEIVQAITTSPRAAVITDKSVYEVSSSATLAEGVVVGATLQAGTLLTDSIRVYDNLRPASDEALAKLQYDISALFLPAGFFRARLSYGLGLSWQLVPITYAGQDKNGNPKLRFTVYGDPEDIETFWQEFWSSCERNNIDPRTCFPSQLRATVMPVEGAVWGQLSAVDYFIANLLQANLLIAAVDVDKLSAQGRSKLSLLALVKKLLPARVCLFVVERQTLTPDDYDLGAGPADLAVPAAAIAVRDTAGVDVYIKAHMAYSDGRPAAYLIPACHGVTS